MDSDQPPGGYQRVLGLWDVAAMTLVGVVALRWLPRAARAGAPSLLLWLFAWLIFFLPLSATVIALTRRYPDHGGLYAWTRRAFGPNHALACGWCLWVNNLFYFPSLLLFGAASAAMALGPSMRALADSVPYSTVVVLALIWLCVAVNVAGYRYARWLHNVGSAGTWLPALLLIGLGAWALAVRGSATSFAPSDLLPHGGWLDTVSLWSAVCLAFSGFELSALSSGEVRTPSRTVPRGVLLAGLAATAIYVLGSGAMLVAVPASALNERTGIIDAIDLMANTVGLSAPGPLIGALLALSAVAMTSSWFAGGSRVLFVAGLDRIMPAWMGRLHPRFRTPWAVLVVQGAGASVLFGLSIFMTRVSGATSIQEAYDVLVNITVLIYFVPYLYLFLARPVLDAADPAGRPRALRSRVLVWGTSLLGFSATACAMLLSLVPPPGTRPGISYELSLLGQAGLIVGVGFVLSWLARRGSGGRGRGVPSPPVSPL